MKVRIIGKGVSKLKAFEANIGVGVLKGSIFACRSPRSISSAGMAQFGATMWTIVTVLRYVLRVRGLRARHDSRLPLHWENLVCSRSLREITIYTASSGFKRSSIETVKFPTKSCLRRFDNWCVLKGRGHDPCFPSLLLGTPSLGLNILYVQGRIVREVDSGEFARIHATGHPYLRYCNTAG